MTTGQLIEIAEYDGKPRDDVGEVYKLKRDPARRDTLVHVRLFACEGEPPQFRNFWASKLRAR